MSLEAGPLHALARYNDGDSLGCWWEVGWTDVAITAQSWLVMHCHTSACFEQNKMSLCPSETWQCKYQAKN